MKFFWDNYTKGAVTVMADQVEAELFSHGARSVLLRDSEYYALDEARLKSFVYRYHVSTNIVWKPNGADCDKWSLLCRADILRGAIEQNFLLAPMFGWVDFSPSSGGRHETCFARTASGLYLFYEPQTRKWTSWLIGKDYDFES